MFTGLVETTGTLVAVDQPTDDAPRLLHIRSALPGADIAVGDSIALDGCCLTVVSKEADVLRFEAATETLRRTTLGKLGVGSTLNMERSLRLSDRLGGHFVSGHVDAVATVEAMEQRGSAYYLSICLSAPLVPLVAAQGAITLAGVSLTVTERRGRICSVALIPHTLSCTTLGTLAPGDGVNVEVDMLARYVSNLLQAQQDTWHTPQEHAG